MKIQTLANAPRRIRASDREERVHVKSQKRIQMVILGETIETKESNKPATIIPNIIKCVKHDTKCEEDANLDDFIDEVFQIEEAPIIETFTPEDDEGTIWLR